MIYQRSTNKTNLAKNKRKKKLWLESLGEQHAELFPFSSKQSAINLGRLYLHNVLMAGKPSTRRQCRIAYWTWCISQGILPFDKRNQAVTMDVSTQKKVTL